jgi:hypothetical protein
MKNDTKEAEKIKELLKEAGDHPMMKQILAEKAAAVLAKRMEAAGKIEVLKKEREEVIPKLLSDLEGKEAKFNKAKAALDAATDEFWKAKAALSSESHSFNTAVGREEQVLIETAPPEIGAAIEFFQKKLSWLRTPGRINRRGGSATTNIFTLSKELSEETNREAVLSALQYCMAAVPELERMKLEPVLDVEKIERMKAGVPGIEIYSEVTGEKPLPRVNTDPRSLLPSDDQLNWQLGKLNEKFQKLMHRR